MKPTADMERAFERYLALLLQWNERINLTAVRDAASIRTKHFLDSLAVVPFLPEGPCSLIDVGSGAGFPGAVIAVARPDIAVSLVESNQKKVAFLRTLVRELQLTHTEVRAERAEAITDGPWDVAVSRATLDLPEWLKLGAKLVRTGGLVIGMEGAEEHELPAGAERHRYTLDGSRRALILFHVER